VTTTSKKSRAQFACIRHRLKTKNWRKLKDYIDKDTEENILSKRKKEGTFINASGYT
jgi:hypothetical protein